MLLTSPISTRVNTVPAAGTLAPVSDTKPVTFIPYNLPFVKPALSTSVPVFVFVPTYTYTWPPVASSKPTTTVLLLTAGLATAFS